MYQPSLDLSLSLEQRTAVFDKWIGGYYAHGSTLDSLSETPLADPPSAIGALAPEEKAAMTYLCPEVTDLDLKTMDVGTETGLIASLRERTLYLPGQRDGDAADGVGKAGNGWRSIEVRLVWCEKSVMEVSYGMMLLGLELKDARRKGAGLRNVSVVRVREGNHFVREFEDPGKATVD